MDQYNILFFVSIIPFWRLVAFKNVMCSLPVVFYSGDSILLTIFAVIGLWCRFIFNTASSFYAKIRVVSKIYTLLQSLYPESIIGMELLWGQVCAGIISYMTVILFRQLSVWRNSFVHWHMCVVPVMFSLRSY